MDDFYRVHTKTNKGPERKETREYLLRLSRNLPSRIKSDPDKPAEPGIPHRRVLMLKVFRYPEWKGLDWQATRLAKQVARKKARKAAMKERKLAAKSVFLRSFGKP